MDGNQKWDHSKGIAMEYHSHNGKKIEMSAMAEKHLDSAIAKLEKYLVYLDSIIQETDPKEVKKFRKAFENVAPILTPEELVQRAEACLQALKTEKERRIYDDWAPFMQGDYR